MAHSSPDDLDALASCQSLTKLSLRLSQGFSGLRMGSFDWASFWGIFAGSLVQLCPSIREISLRLSFNGSGNANDAPELHFGDGIEVLDAAFGRDALAGLKRVLFSLSTQLGYEGDEAPEAPVTLQQLEDVIGVKLPKLHKRGIALLEYEYDTFSLPDVVSNGGRLCGRCRHTPTRS